MDSVSFLLIYETKYDKYELVKQSTNYNNKTIENQTHSQVSW